jgi:drug/metabolite transporter (DMT)-like permease
MDKFLAGLQRFFGNYPFSVIFTNIFAAVFGLAIAWLCYEVSLGEPLQQVFNALLAILGALVGWALGMFFAPYTDKEAERFSSIGQAVSAFVSGYIISKLDRFLEATMFQAQAPVTITWVRFGLLFCSMLLVMLTVFSNRAYFRSDKAP